MDNSAQERYYEDVHLATAPIRWAFSVLQTVFIGILVVVGGVGYPLYLLVSGQHVSMVSLVIAGLVVLGAITFFLAPIYVSVGGVLGLYLLAHFVVAYKELATNTLSGWGTALLVLGFLVLGLLQRYIRYLISRPAPVKRRDFSLFDRSDRLARSMGQMGPLQFQTMRTLHGDNYKEWPIR
jgi:hypothetical protein